MRRLILSLVIAGFMVGPVALAAGGGGGGHGGSMGGQMGGGRGGAMGGQMGGMGGMGGQMGGQMGNSMGGGMGADASAAHGFGSSDPRSGLHGDNANTPEQAMFGRSTASRARLLKDADLATRQAFGSYQSTLAKSQGRQGTSPTGSVETLSEINGFVADTQARAKELKDADRATRRAFGTLQASLAREQGMERAAGQASVNAAFGQDTASRAQLQRTADPQTRKAFGADQSTRAKTKAKLSSN